LLPILLVLINLNCSIKSKLLLAILYYKLVVNLIGKLSMDILVCACHTLNCVFVSSLPNFILQWVAFVFGSVFLMLLFCSYGAHTHW